MKRKPLFTLLLLTGITLLLLAACGGNAANGNDGSQNTGNTAETDEPAPATAEPTEEPAPELVGDALRGGLMYDKWWKIVGAEEPSDDHPLWATQTDNTRGGGDTWRCKECHGWDYKGAEGAYASGSHYTGFIGVFQLFGGDANEILSAMQGDTNSDHDFSTLMDEQALTDIALFIAEEIVDYEEIIGEDKASLSADMATGETLYQDTCTECHGPTGLAINFKSNVAGPEYIGGLSSGNPWEFLHKARFGQPGVADMPSAIDSGWSLDEQAALLTYAQTLASENLVSQGGQMYDKWWKALGVDEPVGDMPLWATQSTNERDGADSWRCKECHGWDYRGAEGAYSGGSHFTGFKGILNASEMSTEELTAWFDGTANASHDFSSYLDEAAIGMMVAFVQDGTVDMSSYINDDKTVNGDPANGQAFFERGCARCHGEDGKQINFGDDDDPVFAGTVANDNPWETLHKASNGQPATHMTSGVNMGWSLQELVDLLSYVQSLPTE
ncbi:MAG: c-type cytochrome [Chloroflexota bacterium]